MEMLILAISFIVLGAICLTLFLLEKCRKYSVKATMIKAMTSLFFIATCSVGLYKNGTHKLALFVLLALLLGLLGDIWLDFKYVFKSDERAFTYAGFTMFGVAHILYITGMFLEYYNNENFLYIVLPIIVGCIFGCANFILEKPMKLKFGEYKWIVIVYGCLLFSMASSAFSLLILHNFQNTTLWMMFFGGVLFAVSDLILSGTYFGINKERPVDIITNAVTYYAAQYLIAFSVYFIA